MPVHKRIFPTVSGAATGAKLGGFLSPIGAIAGGVIGGGIGFFGSGGNGGKNPDEERLRAFGRQDLSGQIDPVSANAIEGALSRRFNQLRQIQGADFARRGLRRSTIAAGALGRTTDLERRALTETFAAQQFARQSRGANILGGFQAQDLAQRQANAQQVGVIFDLATTLGAPLLDDFLKRRRASQPQREGGIL